MFDMVLAFFFVAPLHGQQAPRHALTHR